MTKAKIIYYLNGEVVHVRRGNYSGELNCTGEFAYGLRAEFQLTARRLFLSDTPPQYYKERDYNKPFYYDRVELYKRNRAGTPRQQLGKAQRLFPKSK